MTSVLEKLKALDEQRAQLLDGAKKEALDNAEKAVAELNELGFHYSLTEGAPARTSAQSAAQSLAHHPQSAKPETFPALSAISKRSRITMGECTGHKRPKSHSLSRSLWKSIWRRLVSFTDGPWSISLPPLSWRATRPMSGCLRRSSHRPRPIFGCIVVSDFVRREDMMIRLALIASLLALSLVVPANHASAQVGDASTKALDHKASSPTKLAFMPSMEVDGVCWRSEQPLFCKAEKVQYVECGCISAMISYCKTENDNPAHPSCSGYCQDSEENHHPCEENTLTGPPKDPP